MTNQAIQRAHCTQSTDTREHLFWEEPVHISF